MTGHFEKTVIHKKIQTSSNEESVFECSACWAKKWTRAGVRITRDLNIRREKETTKTMMLVACGWLYEKELACDESSLHVQQTEYITHYFYSSISIPRVVLTKTDGSETRSRTATARPECLRTNKHTSVRKLQEHMNTVKSSSRIIQLMTSQWSALP